MQARMNISQTYKLLHLMLLTLPILAMLTASHSIAAPSTSETSEQVVKRLQDNYHQIESLRFLFFQTTEGQMAGRSKTGKGNALFVRTAQGSKMRWNYTSPDRQVIISDTKTVSMYFESLNQMIISATNNTQVDILFSFFTEKQKLTDSFTILDSDPTPAGGHIENNSGLKVIYLVPKNPDSQIRTIHLWVTDDSHIRRIELIDHFETRTTINISEIKTNTIKKDDTMTINDIFTFTPPEGTEIIRQ